MNVKSVKRAIGLAASAAGATGMMMLVPAVANAATAHSAHVQTVSTASNVSTANWFDPGSGGMSAPAPQSSSGAFSMLGYRDDDDLARTTVLEVPAPLLSLGLGLSLNL